MCKSLHGMEQQQWYRDWLAPVRDALYATDLPRTGKLIEEKFGLLPEAGLADWEREVTDLTLGWYKFLSKIQGRPRAESGGHFHAELQRLSEPALTPRGETQRRRLLTAHCCTGWLNGYNEFNREDLLGLINDLPDLSTDEFVWHHIAGWAFANRDLELVDRAFEVLLAHPSNLLGQAKWQRVNIMLQLLTGKATRRDVEETIRGMEVLPQLMEFRRNIWPVCVEQGLVDTELEQLLAATTERIKRNPPVPDLEPRTKRVSGKNEYQWRNDDNR